MGNSQHTFAQFQLLLASSNQTHQRTAAIRQLFDHIDRQKTGRITEEMFVPYSVEVLKCWVKLGGTYDMAQILGSSPDGSLERYHDQQLNERLLKTIRDASVGYFHERAKAMLPELTRVIFDRVLFEKRREAWRAQRETEARLEAHLHEQSGATTASSSSASTTGGVVGQLLAQSNDTAMALTWDVFSTYDWAQLLPRLVESNARAFRRRVMVDLPGNYVLYEGSSSRERYKRSESARQFVCVGGFIRTVYPVWYQSEGPPSASDADAFRLSIVRTVREHDGGDGTCVVGGVYLDEEYELEQDGLLHESNVASNAGIQRAAWNQLSATQASEHEKQHLKKRRAYDLTLEPHALFQNANGVMEFALQKGSTVAIDCAERCVVFHLVLNASLTLDLSVSEFSWGKGLLELQCGSNEMSVVLRRYGDYDHLQERYKYLIALVPLCDIRMVVCSFYFNLPSREYLSSSK